VPDSTTNVFIPAGTPNTATILGDSDFVKRLRVAPGATVNITIGTKLIADSSVEAGGGNSGGGTIVLRGTGDITGDLGGGSLGHGYLRSDRDRRSLRPGGHGRPHRRQRHAERQLHAPDAAVSGSST